jgi:hypothetical protein
MIEQVGCQRNFGNGYEGTVKKKTQPSRPKSAPGPKPNVLKLKGSWQQAVRQSLKKKKPPEGWPK